MARANQCQSEQVDARVTTVVRRSSYTNCLTNADVVLYTIDGGGHTWPGGEHLSEWLAGKTNDDISASELMLAVLRAASA